MANKKIYFSGSIAGGRGDEKLYMRIISYIQKTDTVLTEHIGDLSLEQPAPDDELYRNDIAWLEESDMVIAECTCPSLGVGYELAYAEKIRKPCHVFCDKTRARLSAMIAGDPYFIVHLYEKEEEIWPILDEILK
jgi:hypothetical protein